MLALAVLLAAPVSAQEQASDTTFLNRNLRQQMFLVDYLKEKRPVSPPAAAEEIDMYVAEAARAWAENAAGEDPLVGQFNAYVVMWLLLMAYADAELVVPSQAECHAYAEYAVPAFLADFERYSEIASVHAPLIHLPSHDWAGGALSLGCELEPAQWTALEAAFARVPAVTRSYLEQGAYPDERTAETIRRVRHIFERNAPLYDIRDALYRGELDAAFAGLAAATTRSYGEHEIRPLAHALWKAYARADSTDHALATLDLLARTLTAADLPRDTLRAWYAAVEPVRGPPRFDLMTASTPAPLIPTGERADLHGTYTDLLTGESVDLAALDGQLILIDFWATWCSPCIAEIPVLRDLASEYEGRLTFVSINADAVTGGEGPDGIRSFMNEHGIDYPVLYDEPERSLVTRFRVRGYPAKFLINPKGVLLVHPSDGRRTVHLEEVETYLEGIR